jgi:hypothetical protein
MQFAEIGNLLERQRGVLDQPYGGRFGHQGHCAHGGPLRAADDVSWLRRYPTQPPDNLEITGIARYIGGERARRK